MGFWNNIFGTKEETDFKKTEKVEEEEEEIFKCDNCSNEFDTQEEADKCCDKFICDVCGEVYYDEDEAIECCEKTYKFTIKSEITIEIDANTQEEAQKLAEDFDEYGEELFDEAKIEFIERITPVYEEKKEEEIVEEDTKPKKEVIRKKKKEE